MKATLIASLLVLVSMPVMAEEVQQQSGVHAGKPYFEASQKITKQATVLALDAKTRMVTLLSESGDTSVVEAGPEVKNFAQIRVKDVVKISYSQSLRIHVEAAGAAEVVQETMEARAKPGEKPRGSRTQRMSYKATIQSIDKQGGSATLKGYDGEEFAVWPRNPETLDKVAVGEVVVFTYTEAIAAKVEKAKAKPTPRKK